MRDLDFSIIRWDQFQTLIAELLTEVYKEKCEHPFFVYGTQGYAQDGIDVIGPVRDSELSVVAECKTTPTIAPDLITKSINEFLKKNKFVIRGNIYIFCTTCKEEKPAVIDRWKEEKERLRQLGIHGVFLNGRHISQLLLRYPEIVEHYWGPDIAEHHRVQVPFRRKYPHRYLPEFSSVYKHTAKIEDQLVSLDLYLPANPDKYTGGIFHFSRQDLSGHHVACEGKNMVRLLQEKAHANSFTDITRYVSDYKQSEKIHVHFFSHAFTLEAEDIPHFSWVLGRAWELYYQHAFLLAGQWQTHRFKRLPDGRDYSFGLCKVSLWFWQQIVSYTQEYANDNGSTERHIFLPSGSAIIVLTPDERANMDRGFHVNIEARPESSLSAADVVLAWTPAPSFTGGNIEISPRVAWDVLHSYTWLIEDFLPQVYDWLIQKYHEENPVSWWKRIFHSRSTVRLISLNECFTSLERKSLIYPVTDKQSALELVQGMQSYYLVYSRSGIERKLISAIIKICKDIIGPESDCDERYIRSKLNLSEGTVYADLKGLLADEEGKIYPNASMFELSLRVLKAVVEDIDNGGQGIFNMISAQIKLAYERYLEDTICDSFY